MGFEISKEAVGEAFIIGAIATISGWLGSYAFTNITQKQALITSGAVALVIGISGVIFDQIDEDDISTSNSMKSLRSFGAPLLGCLVLAGVGGGYYKSALKVMLTQGGSMILGLYLFSKITPQDDD